MIMSEEDIFKGDFLFISYSHKDQDVVRQDVSALIDKGARLWIDHRDETHENMTVGDNWVKKAKNALSHKKCKGVIFYVSHYALASRAVQREQAMAREIFQDKNLFIVNIGAKDMGVHYMEASRLCYTADYYNPEYMFKIFPEQQTFFNNDRISVQRTNHTDAIYEIEEKVLRPLGIIDDAAVLINDLSQTAATAKSRNTIVFGVYKDKRHTHPIDHVDNSRFSSGEQEFIHHNGQIFTTKKLDWNLLYEHDSTAVLLCSEIIECLSAIDTSAFLRVFKNLVFNAKEKEIVKTVRLFRKDDETKINAGDREELLALHPQKHMTTWWIENEGLFDHSWRLAYKDTQPYGHGFLATLPKGVRPVIEIESSKLKEYCKGE